MDPQQLVQEWNLNRGLILFDNSFIPSDKVLLDSNGEINITEYFGDPLVYFNAASEKSSTNSIAKNPWDLLRKIFTFPSNSEGYHEVRSHLSSHSKDIIVLFPIAEITYEASIERSAEEYINFEKNLSDVDISQYGQFIATKLLVGGKFVVRNYFDMTNSQRNLLRSHIIWALEAVRISKENIFQNASIEKLSKIEYEDQKIFRNPIELKNWMRKIYDDTEVELIAYEEVVQVPYLTNYDLAQKFSERLIPGINFSQKEITLNEWVSDVASINLVTWSEKFNLRCGMKIVSNKIISSEDVATNFKSEPKVSLKNNIYIQAVQSSTDVDEFLLNNNILCSFENIYPIPFYDYFIDEVTSKKVFAREKEKFMNYIIRIEKIELSLDVNSIEQTTDFRNAIRDALKQIKPYLALRKVFEKYGYLWPAKIVLGKTIRKRCTKTSNSNPSECILLCRDQLLENKIEELVSKYSPYLSKKELDGINFLDSHGYSVCKNELNIWIKDHVNFCDYYIIGYDEFIPMYKILDREQQREIELVLNNRSDYRILMTGVTEYINISANDSEHVQICFQEPLNSREYEVFGLAVDEKDNKIEDCIVKFELYDYYEFSAIIKNDSSLTRNKM
ncbi:7852_t:CDS:1 [Acaulospora colombiana]|uniref:7852_t:CDS:1 n=1 Tax=Acaulospora colombiana TaxID=27376 RepID=A0ACA9MNI1_9GLOM|nr:7852_t:CDS:1 [Acaulospora colombiana]